MNGILLALVAIASFVIAFLFDIGRNSRFARRAMKGIVRASASNALVEYRARGLGEVVFSSICFAIVCMIGASLIAYAITVAR